MSAAAGSARPRLRLTRAEVVLRIRRDLEREGYPRLQMMLIVAITGGGGLLASFLLLHAGVDSMALRYPLALAAAYALFLVLLWLWLRVRDGGFDLPDPGIDLTLPEIDLPARGAASVLRSGRGGDFAGAGGGASFEPPRAAGLADARGAADLPADAPALGLPSVDLPDLGDVDELAIPLVVIALAIGLALASFYVIWGAPILFAELLADGALSYALYRRLAQEPREHWLGIALRRTALPFALTAVLLAALGWAMAAGTPGAKSIGDVVKAAARQH